MGRFFYRSWTFEVNQEFLSVDCFVTAFLAMTVALSGIGAKPGT